MSNKSIPVLWLFVLTFGALALYDFFLGNSKNIHAGIAYVNLTTVFEDFDFKKEMEVRFRKEMAIQNGLLDSLEFELQKLQKHLEKFEKPPEKAVIDFQRKREHYFERRQKFEQNSIELTKKYDKQILAQMTQYIDDFGKEFNYDYIFGLDESGLILYGREHNDITTEVLAYINQKYQGK